MGPGADPRLALAASAAGVPVHVLENPKMVPGNAVPKGTDLIVAAHTIAGLASVGAPPARYEALLSAPRLVAWKVGVWIKALRPSEEVEWTRTARNVETSLRSAETSR